MTHIKTVQHDCGQLLELHIRAVPQSSKQVVQIIALFPGEIRVVESCPTCSARLRVQEVHALPEFKADDEG